MTQSQLEVLSLVQQSPVHVAAHDRQAWLDLFVEDAVVEDPVGSPAVHKRDGSLARFWDTFIAPNQVRFEVLSDCVQGDDVMREVVIHTELQHGAKLQVPAYLLYHSLQSGGTRRLYSLAAHWTLKHSGRQVRGMGARALLPMTAQFVRMARRMGPAWVWSYLASQWNGVGVRGVRSAESLAKAITARDADALRTLFADGAELMFGALRTTPDALFTQLPAGSRLSIEAPIAAGWVTACRFRIEGPKPSSGLALFATDQKTNRLSRARFFVAAEA